MTRASATNHATRTREPAQAVRAAGPIMSSRAARPTGREITFDPEQVIVSKTDLRGRITYANDVFMHVAGYTEEELLDQPHSIIRHPDMPRCVFKLVWDTIAAGHEIFGYVVNLAKNGDAYWVLAHITPTFDERGTIIAYHSMRRSPGRDQIEKIRAIYRTLLQEEQKHATKQDGIAASTALLTKVLADAGVTYEQFVFSL